MSSSLHQLNLAFDPAEDRMLLRITAGSPGEIAEYRLWLTRRFVRLLWKALDQMLEADAMSNPSIAPEGRKAIRKFQQDEVLSRADFTTHYTGDAARTPLGPEPLLITRFQVTKNPDGSQILNFQTAAGQGVNLTMNTQLIHSVRKLLADKITEAQWDLPCALYTEDAVYIAEASKSIN